MEEPPLPRTSVDNLRRYKSGTSEVSRARTDHALPFPVRIERIRKPLYRVACIQGSLRSRPSVYNNSYVSRIYKALFLCNEHIRPSKFR